MTPRTVGVLDRKLARELSRLRGQVITIALVIGCGIASFVTLRSTFTSLDSAKVEYYDAYRFADAFVHLKRAPQSLVHRIEAIDGVARAHTRVVHDVLLPLPGMSKPATGRLVSIPSAGQPPLNRVHLVSGRLPRRGKSDEIVLIETFANAHGLTLGDSVPAIIDGNRRDLRIVGVGLSPEYMIVAQPGALAADEAGFAVLWMHREQLAPALQLEGAFNDVVLRLQPGASVPAVVGDLDRLLEPYGGLGAVGRDKQTSNFYLEGELLQLNTFGTAAPAIFLAVAAFLVNVVMSRLISLQRGQIAVLKACGYSNWTVALHYLRLAAVIVVIGALAGIAGGWWLGKPYTGLYTDFFHFPHSVYSLDAGVVATAVGVSLAAAAAGSVGAVLKAVRLPPAEAMRPPSPTSYRASLIDRLGVSHWLGTATTMVIREIRRRPLRTVLSSLGVAAAVGIMVVGRFGFDSFDYLIQGPLHEELRGQVTVAFYTPQPERTARTLEHVPGVRAVEGNRAVPVRFRVGSRWRDSAIMALADEPELRRVVTRSGQAVPVSPHGLTVSRKLAEILGVEAGGTIDAEVREGNRETKRLVVTQLVDDAFGLNGYMTMSSLHQMLGQERSISLVYLRIDPSKSAGVHAQLKKMPQVAQVTRKRDLVERFEETSGQYMWIMTLILTGFGSAIAIGVVYNNARVALSTRARDFATLRILGYRRSEVSSVLLGELAVQIALAIPLGLLLGTWWARGIMSTVDPEVYRLPVVISFSSYAYAVAVTVVAGIVSALLVRRKVDRLELTAVLKATE